MPTDFVVHPYEINRIDLGSRMIDGVLCEGTLVSYEITLKNRRERVELEAWRTEEFIFPFNMVFKVRTKESEQITEIRDVVTMTEAELEGRFMPEPHWRESRFFSRTYEYGVDRILAVHKIRIQSYGHDDAVAYRSAGKGPPASALRTIPTHSSMFDSGSKEAYYAKTLLGSTN